MLPLSRPALAMLAIIDTLATWNEFLLALVLINDENWRTFPVGLLQYTLLMAGVLLSILSVLLVFLFLQRHFVTGLTAGAIPRRTMGEWVLRSDRIYASPFADVQVAATFRAPSGAVFTMPGFHDGDGMWRVRFNPGEVGTEGYRIGSTPNDSALHTAGRFEVTPRETKGFLVAAPGDAWGFRTESREPALVFGDTVYNLFGMAHCGADVDSFLRRRAAQGFNLLRIRVPVSSFHPPDGHSDWQTRRTWAWGGEQAPRVELFNLEWFCTVDRVMRSTT